MLTRTVREGFRFHSRPTHHYPPRPKEKLLAFVTWAPCKVADTNKAGCVDRVFSQKVLELPLLACSPRHLHKHPVYSERLPIIVFSRETSPAKVAFFK